MLLRARYRSQSEVMEPVRRRPAAEGGVAHLLALLLVVVVATLVIVALVDASDRVTMPSARQPAGPRPPDAAAIGRRLAPAVVDLDITLVSGGRVAARGMILTPSGQVLTNNNVIAGARTIVARAADGRTSSA